MCNLLRSHYKEMNLKSKMRGMFLALAVMYLLVSFLALLTMTFQSAEQYLSAHSRTVTESVGENLNAKLRNVNTMASLIIGDKQVIRYLKYGKLEDSMSASANATKISAYFDYVHSIFLIADNDQYTFAGGCLVKVDQDAYRQGIWKEELDRRRGGYLIRLNGGGVFQAANDRTEIISFMRRVYDVDTLQPIGYLVVNLSVDILKDIFQKANGSFDSCYFMDLDGNCLREGYEKEFLDMKGDTALYTQKAEKYFMDMRILTTFFCAKNSLRIGIREKVSYVQLLREQFNVVWLFLIAAIIISYFLLGTFLAKTITNPIEKLCYSMEQVKEGYFRRVSMKLPNDEIGKLKDTYNNMLVETNKLIEYLVEQEKEVQSAELRILQEQINPHFLYNMLDTIGYMIFEKTPEETYDAIEMLGRFYRKFLSKGKTGIPLSDEISIVKDYLGLQKLRYGEMFEAVYEVPEYMEDIDVPKLMLQPLVENSINHGIRPKGEYGKICIQVIPEKCHVIVRVRDNGVGMTDEEMKEQLYRENNKSFGFRGTVERLEHYYGVKNICTVESRKGEFFQVTIRIPKGKQM